MLQCSACQTLNPDTARFCNGCGQRFGAIATRVPEDSTPTPDGQPAGPAAPAPERVAAPLPTGVAHLIAAGGPGEEIILPAGDFPLDSVLTIAGDRTIRGAGRDLTTIHGSSAGTVISITGGAVTLAQIGVRRDEEAAGDVVTCTGGALTLDHCRISGGSGACQDGRSALRVSGGRVNVRATDFQNNAAMAVYASEGGNLRVEESTFGGNDIGIGVDGPAQAVLVRNTISFHTYGIVAGGAARVEIVGNTCTGDAGSAEAQADSAGIALTGTATGVARANICTRTKFGISADQHAQVELADNHCHDNKFAGIVYSGEAGGSAHGNRCEANNDGILLIGQAAPNLEGNTFQGNHFSGMDYTGTSAGAARRNLCAGNAKWGIVIAGQAAPLIEGNSCTGNKADGIAAINNAQPRITGNICQGNGGFGISVFPTTRAMVMNNQDYGNGGWAWAVRGGGAPAGGPR